MSCIVNLVNLALLPQQLRFFRYRKTFVFEKHPKVTFALWLKNMNLDGFGLSIVQRVVVSNCPNKMDFSSSNHKQELQFGYLRKLGNVTTRYFRTS